MSGQGGLWSRQWGTNAADEVVGISIASNDTLYLAGNSGGVDTADKDVFVQKISGNDRNIIWEIRFGCAGDADWAQAITVDTEGNIVVVGNTRGSLFSKSEGSNDFFVAKLHQTDGSLIWGHQAGSIGEDSGEAVAVDSVNDIFICGSSSSPGKSAINK